MIHINIIKISNLLTWIVLGIIILCSSTFSWLVALEESAIMDELAHIPAGYSYIRYFDYRLNPEHPPLLKAFSALPLLFNRKINFPIHSTAWEKDINGQWDVGTLFLYQSNNNADQIIQLTRIGPLIINILIIIFIYIWAKELMGRWWAFLPAILFAFSPTVLAHSHYVTTDIAITFGILIAFYYFIKYLLRPSKLNLLYAGLTFGIAQLMKFSAVILIPIFIFLVIIYIFWQVKNKITGQNFISKAVILKDSLQFCISLFLIFLIGYLLVYLIYFIFTINYPIEKQIHDTKFILNSFADGPDPSLSTCNPLNPVPFKRHLRCLAEINILIAENNYLRPLAHYLLGVLMVVQRSSGGNTAYFLGEISASGWWYYFPILFLLKEPLPSLLLITIAFLSSLWGILKKLKNKGIKIKILTDYLGTNFSEFTMIVFICIYWLYSIKSPLNIGIRHILPTMPFIYILTASAIKKIITANTSLKNLFHIKIFLKKSLQSGLIIVLLTWYLMETLITYPYFLSYFNQLGGTTKFGYHYATDSNYDWGQDLKRLKDFIEKNKIEKIAIDYFGGGNPKYYLKDKAEIWWSAKGSPAQIINPEKRIHWLAVSINTLNNAKGKTNPNYKRNKEDEYIWLENFNQPFARAGTSIFIYKL